MPLKQSKTLELTWNKTKHVFILRILHERIFITPKLPLTIVQLQSLLCGHSIKLMDWVELRHSGTDLDVQFRKEWPSSMVKWGEFMAIARQARGMDPLDGWQEVEKQEKMDRARAEFGYAED